MHSDEHRPLESVSSRKPDDPDDFLVTLHVDRVEGEDDATIWLALRLVPFPASHGKFPRFRLVPLRLGLSVQTEAGNLTAALPRTDLDEPTESVVKEATFNQARRLGLRAGLGGVLEGLTDRFSGDRYSQGPSGTFSGVESVTGGWPSDNGASVEWQFKLMDVEQYRRHKGLHSRKEAIAYYVGPLVRHPLSATFEFGETKRRSALVSLRVDASDLGVVYDSPLSRIVWGLRISAAFRAYNDKPLIVVRVPESSGNGRGEGKSNTPSTGS